MYFSRILLIPRVVNFFAGVPHQSLYDNSKIAIQKIFTHGRRDKTKGFLRLKSYYLFDDIFANPARGNEKGGVENIVGYMRRNFMVPLPQVINIEELNDWLEKQCLKNFKHVQLLFFIKIFLILWGFLLLKIILPFYFRGGIT